MNVTYRDNNTKMIPSDLSIQLRGVFEMCDPGGCGFISLDSLIELGSELMNPEAHEDVKNELHALDTHGTGQIDFEAFCSVVAAVLADSSSRAVATEQGDSRSPHQDPRILQRRSIDHQDNLQQLFNFSSDDDLIIESSGSRGRRVRRNRPRVPVLAMLSKVGPTSTSQAPTPEFIVTTSPTVPLDEERQTEEGGSLTDMDSALGTSSPSLEMDAKRNNSSSSQCSSMSDGESYECLGEGSPGGAVSPVPNNKGEVGGHLRRNTWSRSSLRRTPQSNNNSPATDPNLSRRWGSFRHTSKRISGGSNALPSPLYRSASFNSSGRSSNCGDADDMYCSDASLEEDVMGLNRKVHMLQQQVTALADTQHSTDDRFGRARQDNAVLQARVMILEEQLREEQVRGEERLQDETRRHRDLIARVEREKQLELENSAIRLQATERKCSGLEDEVSRLRAQTERQAGNRRLAEETIADLESTLASLRTEHAELQELSRRQQEVATHDKLVSAQLVAELRQEIAALRSVGPERSPSPGFGGRGQDLEAEVRALREESRGLREALEEAQAQLLSQGLEQGRTLLGEQPVTLSGTSLADELEAMSADKLGADNQLHMDQVRVALREQQEVNLQLRSYIDGILLNIVENYPQLLEVKNKK